MSNSKREVLLIPQDAANKGIEVVLEYCGDGGANLLVGMLQEAGEVAAERVDERFFGYESSGRKPITLRQLQRFVLLVLASDKIVFGSKVLIRILGNLSFVSELQQEIVTTVPVEQKIVEHTSKSVSKHPHHRNRDKRGQHRGRRG
jgi:hypothetical protein